VGPDLVSQYLVYHGWDPGCHARYPRIDRLEWVDDLPRCDGPSWEPRPAPRLPDVLLWFDEEGGSAAGSRGPDRIAGSGPSGRIELREPAGDFAAEVSFRLPSGAAEVRVQVGETTVLGGRGELRGGGRAVAFPAGFRGETWHHLFLRRRDDTTTVTLDEYPTLDVILPPGRARLALEGAAGAEFSHLALTRAD
jgi:hypothetical protein